MARDCEHEPADLGHSAAQFACGDCELADSFVFAMLGFSFHNYGDKRMAYSLPVLTDAVKNTSNAAATAAHYQLELAKQISALTLGAQDGATIAAIAQIIATNFAAIVKK